MTLPNFSAERALADRSTFEAAHAEPRRTTADGIVPQRPCNLTCGMYSARDGSTRIACYCDGVRVV